MTKVGAFFLFMQAGVALAIVVACGSSDGGGSLFGEDLSTATGGAGTESDAASSTGGATSSSGGSLAATGGQHAGTGGANVPTGGAGSGGFPSDATVGNGGAAGSVTQDASPCPSDQKSCGGICVALTPQVGCSAIDCAPCPVAPANAVSVCIAEQCDFECSVGFARSGASCVSTMCEPAMCPPCQNSALSCCKPDGLCGCRFAWNPFCG